MGYSPWDRNEWDTTERLHFHFSLSSHTRAYSAPEASAALLQP